MTPDLLDGLDDQVLDFGHRGTVHFTARVEESDDPVAEADAA